MHAVSAEFQRQLPVVIDKQLQLMFLTKSDGDAQALSELVGRAGFPEELAKAVLFMASDDASFVYGENLVVDGGFSAMM